MSDKPKIQRNRPWVFIPEDEQIGAIIEEGFYGLALLPEAYDDQAISMWREVHIIGPVRVNFTVVNLPGLCGHYHHGVELPTCLN